MRSGAGRADGSLDASAGHARAPRSQIRALTGIRIVAALWVVLFHIRGNIASDLPALDVVIGPLIAHGELGVDLFFALSGYVLALNYTSQMGPAFNRLAAAKFYWARLARVWPVFFLTLLVAGLWHGVLMGVGAGDPVLPRDYSVDSFLRQTLLVALWGENDFDRLMWNGPSWSVSAEAFAYALFPLLALLFYRIGRVVTSRTAIVLAIVAALPVSLFVGAFGMMYFERSWMLRIVCGFVAGALMYEATRRATLTDGQRRLAGHTSLAIVVLVVALCYATDAIGAAHLLPMISPLFVVLIGLLAVGEGSIVRLLSTRAFVTGGAASYSVYMVHMLVIEPLWWAQGNLPALVAPGSLGSQIAFLAVPFVVCAVGYVVWRYFEEPMRHVMRKMSLQHIAPAPLTDSSQIETSGHR